MIKLLTASQLAALPTGDTKFQSRGAEGKVMWVEIINLSQYLWELKGEDGIIRKPVLPFSQAIIPLRIVTDTVILSPIMSLPANPNIPIGNYAVYMDVTETEPELITSLLAGPGVGPQNVNVLTFPLIAGEDQTNNRLLTTSPNEWSIFNAPAVNTGALAGKAGVAGQRHIFHSISAVITTNAAAPAPLAAPVGIQVIDNVTVIWQETVNVTAVIGQSVIYTLPALNLQCPTLGTTLSIAFAAAAGANTFESVAATGITVLN